MKYQCKECKALLKVFRILTSHSWIDLNTGATQCWEEELVPGSEITVQCSKNINHDCGFVCKMGLLQES